MTKRARRRPTRKRSALSFSGTTKYLGAAHAVGPVSFDIEAGQAVALLGHNGSGKSTLLKVAAGLLEPTDGSVKVFGSRAGEPAARAAVSYIGDHPLLYDDLTLREHLDYLSRLHGSDPQHHDVDGLLDRLGLTRRADDLPSTFSRGLRQKAAIAIGLCRPLTVLLIDEPFAGLDRQGQSALLELMAEVRNNHGAVLVATHDYVALRRFDRALVLSDGELSSTDRPMRFPTDPGQPAGSRRTLRSSCARRPRPRSYPPPGPF